MKTILAISLTVLFATITSFASEQNGEKEVSIGINGAYVPGGFDSTSDTYVVVNGVFPNGCYKWSRAERTNRDEYNHEIRNVATVTQGMCIMVLVPFQKEIRLGQLSTGKHLLKFINDDGTYLEKTLLVE